ncbi:MULTISPECIES: YbaB/EbfC family nucleoid-associated protein [unclassified Nocardia]|uniref:YbaB/EbfC family nucleoid-associated protein n=1 Tax=unclassified Nocardia TaxID=2637762 RepID=UPI00278C849A|nr:MULTISPECIES: YbaB/EbfC family nucleoid-associated protein [unclassified Nocardia]
MFPERSQIDAAAVLEGFSDHVRAVTEASKKRAQLTASATTADGRITVTVNADGIVIATQVTPDFDRLSADEIATAFTSAVQQAAQKVAHQVQELMAPLTEQRLQLPKMDELADNLPDLFAQKPSMPAASLTAPYSRERNDEAAAQAAPDFADAEDYDDWQAEHSWSPINKKRR